MQLIERFHAEDADGRVVEILKWAPASVAGAAMGDGMRALYATLQGWRVHPEADAESFTIPSFGLTVRRLRSSLPRIR